MLEVTLLDLIHGEFAVAVLVEGSENLGQVVALLLAHQLGSDEGVSGLLKGNIGLEFAEVVEGVNRESLVHLEGGELSEPWVRQSGFS